jgi:hypothetical protein
MAVPVIDFSKLNGEERAKTLAQIANGCEEWGFFQVLKSFMFTHNGNEYVYIISFKNMNAFHLFFLWFGITYTNMHVNAHAVCYS